MNAFHRTAACCACCLAAACDDTGSDAPPAIRLGHDSCIECGMGIMEDRCSAAAIVEVDGRKEPVLFDDIGCLLDWQESLDEGAIVRRYVHDWGTREWTSAEAATFLMSEAILTPMASWLVAFARAEAAAAAQAEHQGEILAWTDLPKARLRWLEERGWRRP